MILQAQPSDAASLHTLVNSAYRGENSRHGWTTEADLFDGPRISLPEMETLLADDNYLVLKYIEDDDLLGCVALHQEEEKLYLGMLSVNPRLQGKGTGKKLLAAARAVAIEKRCSAVFMTVITIRHELLEWYHRNGFMDTGKRIAFDKEEMKLSAPKMKLELAVLEQTL